MTYEWAIVPRQFRIRGKLSHVKEEDWRRREKIFQTHHPLGSGSDRVSRARVGVTETPEIQSPILQMSLLRAFQKHHSDFAREPQLHMG